MYCIWSNKVAYRSALSGFSPAFSSLTSLPVHAKTFFSNSVLRGHRVFIEYEVDKQIRGKVGELFLSEISVSCYLVNTLKVIIECFFTLLKLALAFVQHLLTFIEPLLPENKFSIAPFKPSRISVEPLLLTIKRSLVLIQYLLAEYHIQCLLAGKPELLLNI